MPRVVERPFLAVYLGNDGAHVRAVFITDVLFAERAFGIAVRGRRRHEVDYDLDIAFKLFRFPAVVLRAELEIDVTVLDAVIVKKVERLLLVDRVGIGEKIVYLRRSQAERVHDSGAYRRDVADLVFLGIFEQRVEEFIGRNALIYFLRVRLLGRKAVELERREYAARRLRGVELVQKQVRFRIRYKIGNLFV